MKENPDRRKKKENGATQGKNTMAVCTPLVDLTVPNPSIMRIPTVEGEKITNSTGQKHAIFTCDNFARS